MLSRVTLVGLFLATWIPGASVCADADVPDSPWQGTGIDFSFAEEYLNDRDCWRSDAKFLSCVGAVQGVLDTHGRDLQLRPESRLSKLDPSPKIMVHFGAAVVTEDRALRVREKGNALEVVRARSHRILRWRDWLESGRRKDVRFSAIRDWLKDEIVEPARNEEFAAAAINGYLGVADAHARIVPAGDVRGASSGRRGDDPRAGTDELIYTGIGAGIQPLVDAALVTSVIREGPAADAGLRVHDFILEVDGAPVTGLSAEALVDKLRGRKGTRVELAIKRQDERFDVSILRDVVAVRNVVAYDLIDRGWQFVYLRIDSFLRGDTCRDVRRELGKQLKPNLNGLILDVRNNAGGLIDQAVCVADLFLPKEEVVLEIRNVRGKKRTEQVRTRRDARVRVPMITLVNASTGSAAEVLTGALQDHGRSYVVGELTFGKGTVQTARPWRGSREILEFFTVARYYRPSGVGVQLIGIEPDIPVAAAPEADSRARVVLREGDMFPTALGREPQEWKRPNPELVARLRECAVEDGLAVHRLRHDLQQGRITDYPLAVSKDALVCRLKRRI